MKICYGTYNEMIPVERREMFAKAFAAKLQGELKAKTGEEVEIVCCPERGDLVAAMNAGYDVVLTEAKLRRPENGKAGEENIGVGTLKEWTGRSDLKRVILILPPNDRPALGKREDGTDCFTSGRKVVELFRKGFYTAVYVTDLKCDLLVEIIKKGRTEAEAKSYYGVTDEMLELLLASEQNKQEKKEKEKKKGIFGIFGRGQETKAAEEKEKEPVMPAEPKAEEIKPVPSNNKEETKKEDKEEVPKPDEVKKPEEPEKAKSEDMAVEEVPQNNPVTEGAKPEETEEAFADGTEEEPVLKSEPHEEAQKDPESVIEIIPEEIKEEVPQTREEVGREDKKEDKKESKGDSEDSTEVLRQLLKYGTDQFFEDDEPEGGDVPPMEGMDFGDLFGAPPARKDDVAFNPASSYKEGRTPEPAVDYARTQAPGTVNTFVPSEGDEKICTGQITSYLNGGTLIAVNLINPPDLGDVTRYSATVICKGVGAGRVINGRYQSSTIAFLGYCAKLMSGRTLLLEVPDEEAPGVNLSGRECMITFDLLQ